MGILNPYMVKQVYGSTDFELEANAGESFLVKNIRVYNPANNYATVKINRGTVGYFRVGGTLGNHLSCPVGDSRHSHDLIVAAANGSLTEDHAVSDAFGVANAHLAVTSDRDAKTTETDVVQFTRVPKQNYKTVLERLYDLEIFAGYPVGEGEKLTITGVKQSACLVMVEYVRGDASQYKPNQENGSDSKEYMLLNYGRVGAAITTTVSTIYDTPQTPDEFPDFPFGKDVPAKNEITLFGILASDIYHDVGSTDDIYSTYLKLQRGRETMFDDDKNGLFHRGIKEGLGSTNMIGRGLSIIGNDSDTDAKPPLIFDPSITFKGGDELGVYLTTVVGAGLSAATLSAADTEVCLVEKVKVQ